MKFLNAKLIILNTDNQHCVVNDLLPKDEWCTIKKKNIIRMILYVFYIFLFYK